MEWPRSFAEIAANGEAGGLGHHEWLGLLLDREASWRQERISRRGYASPNCANRANFCDSCRTDEDKMSWA